MRELEAEGQYRDRVTFEVVDPSAANWQADVERYDLGTHGLAVVDAKGALLGKLPGHEFDRARLVETLDVSLAKR